MQDIIDGVLPFIKYLQSSNDIKKKRGFTYVNSKYNIGILVKKIIYGWDTFGLSMMVLILVLKK